MKAKQCKEKIAWTSIYFTLTKTPFLTYDINFVPENSASCQCTRSGHVSQRSPFVFPWIEAAKGRKKQSCLTHCVSCRSRISRRNGQEQWSARELTKALVCSVLSCLDQLFCQNALLHLQTRKVFRDVRHSRCICETQWFILGTPACNASDQTEREQATTPHLRATGMSATSSQSSSPSW